VLTDSDGAGFVIRNHLKGIIPQNQLKQCYIPDVYGKEKRKKTPGKEGKLGVEGMPPAVLEEALRQCGATILGEAAKERNREEITRLDLFQAGLSGGENSAAKRKALLKRLDLPEHLSANALVQVLNTIITKEEFQAVLQELDK
jgi:ribonuclease M5